MRKRGAPIPAVLTVQCCVHSENDDKFSIICSSGGLHLVRRRVFFFLLVAYDHYAPWDQSFVRQYFTVDFLISLFSVLPQTFCIVRVIFLCFFF